MFRFLADFNPCNSFMNVTDFDYALLDIQAILNKLDLFDHNSSEDRTKEGSQLLEKAFSLVLTCLQAAGKKRPDKQLTLLLADILQRYALICYHENRFFVAKQILVASCGLHLYSIDVLSDCVDLCDFRSLDDLKRYSEVKTSLFQSLEQSILTTNFPYCMNCAHKNSFLQSDSKKHLLHFGEAIRWLGHCYQELEPKQVIPFSDLFKLSESLLLLTDSDASKLALADLYLRIDQNLDQSKTDQPHDIVKRYEACLTYDSSQAMETRVRHQCFLALNAAGYKQEALGFLQQALIKGLSLTETPQKHRLLAGLYNSYANYYFLNLDLLDLEKARSYFTQCVQHMGQCHEKDYPEFAVYELDLAYFELGLGDLNMAKDLIQRALKALKSSPHLRASHLTRAEALHSLITKASDPGTTG